MKRVQTVDPRSLFTQPSRVDGEPSVAPSVRPGHGQQASISSSLTASSSQMIGVSGPVGRTVYDSPPASHFLHMSARGPPNHAPSPSDYNEGQDQRQSSSSSPISAPPQGLYSTSAPPESSGFLAGHPPPALYAPVATPAQPPPTSSSEAGGKVRKGKERAARPVLGLRVKSEDGVGDLSGSLISKAKAQYSACGGCRMRRVRCDLHDVKAVYQTNVLPQHLSLLLTHPSSRAISDNGGYELVHGELIGLDGNRIACTNCKERNLRCVDGLAAKELSKSGASVLASPDPDQSSGAAFTPGPVYSSSGKPKILRKGKRIQLAQSTFGGAPVDPSASTPASSGRGSRRLTVGSADESIKTESSSARSPETGFSELGEISLNPAFLQSAFFRHICIQRPLLHSEDFERRFLAATPALSSSLGVAGALLVKVLFAWARSFGVDSDGNEDTQTTTPGLRRQRRQECNQIVESCLSDIDRAGLMRLPSWDGAQALLLLLPLTEDLSSPLERLSMYECAIGQVSALSLGGRLVHHPNADPSAAPPPSEANELMVEARSFWYCFVHEGVKAGLKGGRLVMSDDDLSEFQRNFAGTPSARAPSHFTLVSDVAASPVKLALACRLVHKALTGLQARRSPTIDSAGLEQAWAVIDTCWEEFDRLRLESRASQIMQHDDLQRFCDGWMILLFECHSAIREALYERYTRVAQTLWASSSPPPEIEIGRLYSIAEGKCAAMSKSIVTIIWRNLSGTLFKYDTGLVRNGTYHAACILAAEHGSAEEINCCLTALDDMRWAFSKSDDKTQHIQAIWSARLESEAVRRKELDHLSPPILQDRFSFGQRPAPVSRNFSYESGLSDVSGQSEQQVDYYTPAFYRADDVHLPPIQGRFTGHQSPVPPTLLRGLAINDDSRQDSPMWIEKYSPASKPTTFRESGASSPSGYTISDSPLQSLGSAPADVPLTDDSGRSNGYMPPTVAHSFAPRRSPLIATAAGDYSHATASAWGQSGYPDPASGALGLHHLPESDYLTSPAETFAPYGDDDPHPLLDNQLQRKDAHQPEQRSSGFAAYHRPSN